MRVLISLLLFLQACTAWSQRYKNIDTPNQGSYSYLLLSEDNNEKLVEDFFNLDISFQQLSGRDQFFFSNDNGKYNLVISRMLREKIKENNVLQQAIYAKLATNAFADSFPSNITLKQKELLTDMVAGYFYCYHNITKNWKKLEGKNAALIKKSIELDALKESYSQILSSYVNEELQLNISSEERISAFLKGTYLAMPVDYRQHITSTVVINNDIHLLIEETQKLRSYVMTSTTQNF